MAKFLLATLTLEELRSLVTLTEGAIGSYPWNQVDQIELSPEEDHQVELVVARLRDRSTTLMNEATIWARAIYPLLLLAETGAIEGSPPRRGMERMKQNAAV